MRTRCLSLLYPVVGPVRHRVP